MPVETDAVVPGSRHSERLVARHDLPGLGARVRPPPNAPRPLLLVVVGRGALIPHGLAVLGELLSHGRGASGREAALIAGALRAPGQRRPGLRVLEPLPLAGLAAHVARRRPARGLCRPDLGRLLRGGRVGRRLLGEARAGIGQLAGGHPARHLLHELLQRCELDALAAAVQLLCGYREPELERQARRLLPVGEVAQVTMLGRSVAHGQHHRRLARRGLGPRGRGGRHDHRGELSRRVGAVVQAWL